MYQLDRTSRKYTCPQCGKKRFVLYVDERGNKLDDSCGRCDRADNCGYHYPPRQYFQDHRPLGNPYPNRDTHPRRVLSLTTKLNLQKPDTLNPTRLASSLAVSQNANPLLRALIPRLPMYADQLRQSFESYGVGTSPDHGCAEFFQIDTQGNIRTGKGMGYDPDAHRNGRLYWMHKEKGNNPDYRLKQCFFGTHLVKPDTAELWLFESEKTALIVSALLRKRGCHEIYLPLACGGCGGLNPTPENKNDPWHALQVLKGKRVILFPDNGKFTEWYAKGLQLKGFCSAVRIASLLEPWMHPLAVTPKWGIKKGCDVADIILSTVANDRCDPMYYILNGYDCNTLISGPELTEDTLATLQAHQQLVGTFPLP